MKNEQGDNRDDDGDEFFAAERTSSREGREGMIHTYPLVKEIKKTTTTAVDISSSASKCSPS